MFGAYDPLGEVCDSGTNSSEVCQTDASNPISGEGGILLSVVNILSWVVGVASVIMILVGGLKFVTSNGDPNSTASARNTVLYALIGVAVFISSRLIVMFVLNNV
ncbi:MAG: pilin [bacterium]|nr:pilin [bacterium]